MSNENLLTKKFHDFDKIIGQSFSAVLTNETINDQYLDPDVIQFLDDSLIFTQNDVFDIKELSTEGLVSTLSLMRKENANLVSILNMVNNERKALKERNFKLMEKLFVFENFELQKLDKDLSQFLSRAVFINYELSKKFLTKEKENNMTLNKLLGQKDDDIKSLKTKISLLEQRVIESRNIFKKTLLEAPNQGSRPNVEDGDAIPSAESIVRQKSANSALKLSSPSSQQDTTSDSVMKAGKDLTQLVTQKQTEGSSNEKIQSPIYDKPSRSSNQLEDNMLRGISPTRKSVFSSPTKERREQSTDSNSSKSQKKDQRDSKGILRQSSMRTNNVQTPASRFAGKVSPNPNLNSSSASNSSKISTSQKKEPVPLAPKNQKSEGHTKFKAKLNELSLPAENENLTLSFLLDQNVSHDNIIPMSLPASTKAGKELAVDLKRRMSVTKDTVSQINNGRPESTTSKKTSVGKFPTDTPKGKTKVVINTSPVTVKKRPTSNNENK